VPAPRPTAWAGAPVVESHDVSGGLRVLVVDDDPFTRSVLGPALTTRGWTVTLCASASAAMSEAAQHAVDAALVDLDLGPGPDGLDLAVALRRQFPLLPIVILTSYQSPQLLDIGHDRLPMGVRYVVKGAVEHLDDLDTELRTAIRHPLDVTVPGRQTVRTTSGQRLSARQLDVMRLVAAGHGNAEIASELGMGETAVEKAVARLIRQLGLDKDPRRNKRVLVAEAYFNLSRPAGRRGERTEPG
jgi:DNA-binding NarL/FixJ family response regulator